ncbi:hypothetical protein BX661DRAFT_40170 [Kickxella alabastrina]|uniref:uncharacterized protein n=1 Tax=Kickxella alabastrina TaxID=61397 RepID=UPI00222091EA|nr:uncharacterized protein BX661DRAFT_40170 [Kickxella alabastrina]KAI7825591.1 hypothetical protein BX661DRAFT_40170 [Kickxella alabastrina]
MRGELGAVLFPKPPTALTCFALLSAAFDCRKAICIEKIFGFSKNKNGEGGTRAVVHWGQQPASGKLGLPLFLLLQINFAVQFLLFASALVFICGWCRHPSAAEAEMQMQMQMQPCVLQFAGRHFASACIYSVVLCPCLLFCLLPLPPPSSLKNHKYQPKLW